MKLVCVYVIGNGGSHLAHQGILWQSSTLPLTTTRVLGARIQVSPVLNAFNWLTLYAFTFSFCTHLQLDLKYAMVISCFCERVDQITFELFACNLKFGGCLLITFPVRAIT